MSISRDKDVLWFEIPVANVKGVAILHGAHHLSKDVHRVMLAHLPISVDIREHVLARAVFENKVTAKSDRRQQQIEKLQDGVTLHFVPVLPDVKNLDDIWMLDQLHDCDLSLHGHR